MLYQYIYVALFEDLSDNILITLRSPSFDDNAGIYRGGGAKK